MQLIPAAGWRGLYAHDESGKVTVSESPVLCFALVELCDGDRLIEPYLGHWDEIDRGPSCANFLGILGPGEDVDGWVQRDAERHVQRERERQAKAAAPGGRP